jgi:type I restriction enzyme M protein
MEKLTQARLDAHLLEAAHTIRGGGGVDSADFKNYVLGLLFLKRLSDVYDEETERLLREHPGNRRIATDPDEHEFDVPTKAQWKHLTTLTKDLGKAINTANDLLEEKNPAIESVLSATDFNDKARLPDDMLEKLIIHFSKIRLRNEDLGDPDILGRAYEYLIDYFAADAGKKGGEFYTPKEVARLLAGLLEPVAGMAICDPTCGSGGMLIQCAERLREAGMNARNLILHGQERNRGTWAIGKMNMLLHGLSGARIDHGDTIRDPKLVQNGKLISYDLVIANPPFSLKNWGIETAAKDAHDRFRYGIPPKSYGDYAFVQHMIAILKPAGRAGVVLSHGVLFRGGAEGKIRKALIEQDLIEGIIGLPHNLFYGASIPACLLILNRRKAADRKGKILFIHAAREYQEGKKQNKLRDRDIEKITSTFRSFVPVERYARPVPLDEVRGNDHNLNISRYVDIAEPEPEIDVQQAIAELTKARAARDEAESRMLNHLQQLGYKV